MEIKISGELSDRLVDGLTLLSAAYTSQQDCIRVWTFADAPQELRALMGRGGNENWIAVVPATYEDRHYVEWLDPGYFGPNVDTRKLADGTTVYLAYH